jgi:DNA-binding response OmpR family regulator
MSANPSVLIIEDEPVQMQLTEGLLEPYYQVKKACNGDEAIAAFSAQRPDLILMDKRLPGIDGAHLCRLLRQDAIGVMPPVLFVSAEITLEDRLAAYSAGGEDFIAKPFAPEELLAKIDVALRNVAERQRLEGSAKSAFTTAMTAMSSASEIGTVLHTLRESFQTKNLTSLCQCLVNACDSYGIKAVAQIRGEREMVTLNQNGVASPLEIETFTSISERGRIMSSKDHAAFNYGHVTILTSELSALDPERLGRMRDNLALIAEGIDARVASLENEAALNKEHQYTLRLFALSTSALQNVDQEFRQQFVEVRLALTRMIDDAEAAFFSLGLTENQEKQLSVQLKKTENQLLAIFERGLDIEEHLSAIQKMMESRVAK